MRRILLRYGLISSGLLIGVNVLILLILGIPGPEDYALGEVIGYATIIVALVPVFFAVKDYRDDVSDGTLSFPRAVGVGIAVAVIPSIAFALYNLIYVNYVDPDFAAKYLQYSLNAAQDEMTTEEFQRYAADVEAQSAVLTDPFVQSILMFLTVFLVGVVIAVLSGIVLRRKKRPVSRL